jgi:hypothetical protein
MLLPKIKYWWGMQIIFLTLGKKYLLLLVYNLRVFASIMILFMHYIMKFAVITFTFIIKCYFWHSCI